MITPRRWTAKQLVSGPRSTPAATSFPKTTEPSVDEVLRRCDQLEEEIMHLETELTKKQILLDLYEHDHASSCLYQSSLFR